MAACCGLLLPAAAVTPATTPRVPPVRGNWLRVRTANFTLYGDATEAKIKDVGLEMEKLRAVLASFKNGEARSPVPTVVLVFRDITQLDPYRPLYKGRPKPMGALFLQGHDGNFVALSAGWNLDARPFIYHEYLHDFMRSNFLPQPLWYEEGLASSTARSAPTLRRRPWVFRWRGTSGGCGKGF
jgi:hypothetical protein